MFVDVVFGASFVPKSVRLLLALSLSLMVFPQVSVPNMIHMESLPYAMMWLEQLLIGASMAFIFQLIFQMLLLAGQLIASLCGLSFATLIDPNVKSHLGMLSELYYLSCTLLFLAQNGHLMVLQVLVLSFQHLPLQGITLQTLPLSELSQFAGLLFSGGLNIALPAVTSLIVVQFTFALLTRSAPQMNLFNIGLPITLIAGFVILFLSYPILLNSLDHFFQTGFSLLHHHYGEAI